MVRIATAFFVVLTLVASAHATLVLPLNIEVMTDESDKILSGVVISVSGEKENDLRPPSVVTRVRVEEIYKGKVGEIEEVRQLGIVKSDGSVITFGSLPRFRVGERVLLFLSAPSRIGFVGPIGLGQGVFRITAKASDTSRSLVTNEVGNRNLFRNVQGARVRSLARQWGAEEIGKGRVPVTLGRIKELVAAHRGLTP